MRKERSYYYHTLLLLIILVGAVTGCSDEKESDLCQNRLYYVSSAVCSESDLDAAVRDYSGEIYIAKDIFMLIDRADVTVDQVFVANYRVIQAADNRVDCGGLINAAVIELMCLEVD